MSGEGEVPEQGGVDRCTYTRHTGGMDLIFTTHEPPQRGRSHYTYTVHLSTCRAAGSSSRPIDSYSEGRDALLRKVRHSLGAKACARCKPVVDG